MMKETCRSNTVKVNKILEGKLFYFDKIFQLKYCPACVFSITMHVICETKVKFYSYLNLVKAPFFVLVFLNVNNLSNGIAYYDVTESVFLLLSHTQTFVHQKTLG